MTGSADRIQGIDPLRRLEAIEEAIGSRLEAGEALSVSVEPLERLLEISRAMNRIHDRNELLSRVGDWLRELFDAENSFVILFDEEGRPQVHSAFVKEGADEAFPVSATILERVRESREPVLIDNAADLPDLRDQSSIKRLRISSVLCAPLIVGDLVIGALQFDHRGEPHPFPRNDRRLLAMFADQAATAFNNLQLIEKLNQAFSEVQRTQARMVQAERLSAVGEMAAGIAHDFNNTLFVALGFCDILLQRRSLGPEERSSLERIRTCALDAANTVRRLQNFAQGRAQDARVTNVDLSAVVEDIVDFTRTKWCDEAQLRGVSIEILRTLGPTPPVRANPADLREVLTNLVFNAVDAMERSGVIRLKTGCERGRVYASVEDEGIGMDDATRQRVFEPFFTTKGPRGHGFGLSTCWNIAQVLGGEITVDSQLGRGSCFTLWLPAARPEDETPEDGAQAPSGGAYVLVIDDDPDVLRTVTSLVEVLGHRVTGFTNPRKALEAIAREAYDVVITDLGMPGMSGTELVRELIVEHPDLPILILTGWGADIEIDHDISAHVQSLLSKPITLDALGAALARALAARRS